jgi:hypothetical protein
MAGMDYAHLSFGTEGKVRKESFIPIGNYIVDPFKVKLHITHTENSNFALTMFNGSISLDHIHIYAKYIGSSESRMVWLAHAFNVIGDIEHYCGVAVYGHMDTARYYAALKGFDLTKHWRICSTNAHSEDKRRMREYLFDDDNLEDWGSNDPDPEMFVTPEEEVEPWVGVTKWDLEELVTFLRESHICDAYIEAVQKEIDSYDFPEVDITSYLEGNPSLYSMMWGKKKGIKEGMSVKEYL